ncbi:MAG: CDP-glycerol glycerophosphotransferase family protein [Clostridia bacterium]|nr:CDP-glycerol glycerophosphotransferase family protein [Clostridia bacterium]
MIFKRISNSIHRKLVIVDELLKYYLLYPLAAIYRKRDIWIIAERGMDARDNGFHLFRYIRETDPSREVYYIISKKSPDRKHVEPYGNVVDYRSLKHYLLFIAAKVKISTHIMGFSPHRGFYSRMINRLRLPGKTVFLQHGVTQSDIRQLYAKRARRIFSSAAQSRNTSLSAPITATGRAWSDTRGLQDTIICTTCRQKSRS